MKKIATFIFILSTLCLFSCSHADNKPQQLTLKNGDVVKIVKQKVTVYNKQGQMIQQSTFIKPNFVEARGFLTDLQQDIKQKDFSQIIEDKVSYPLRVNQNGKGHYYQNSEQLEPDFNKVFTADILKTISTQNPYLLFSNFQGVMIGGGSVWFSDKGITSINLVKKAS